MIIIIGGSSCEVTPSEIPWSSIEEPQVVPDISIKLSPEMDTLRLSESTWVTYLLETGDRRLYYMEMYLDGEEIVNKIKLSDREIKAYINTDLSDDGIHTLKINIYTTTNTGSIADKIGYEAYLYQLQWPVYINKSAKEDFKFTNLEISSRID